MVSNVQCVNRCEIQALLEKFQIQPNFSVAVTPSFSIFHCIRQEGTLKVFPMEYYARLVSYKTVTGSGPQLCGGALHIGLF